MTKRKVSLALILTMVVAGLILAMLPAGAVAAPGIIELNWAGAAYEGTDSFYGTTVVAYTQGSTAELQYRVQNDSANDLKINAAVVTFDWGTCSPTVPTVFPFTLKAGTFAIFEFDCAIPADATNQTLHSYKVEVHYEGMYGPAINSLVNFEAVSGLNLAYDVAVPGSVTLWDVTATGAQLIPTDKYSVAYLNGAISWVAPYTGPAGSLYATYEFIEDGIGLGGADVWMAGNGVKTVFRFQTSAANLPIVADSVKVVKKTIAPISSVTKIDTGWTVDLVTGTVTFTEAPAAYESVGVFYKNYNSFIQSGSIAVVSADQADYTTLWRRYNEVYGTEYFGTYLTGEAMQLWGEAEAARAAAEIMYREGQFADAKASMETALSKANAAIAAEAAVYGTVADGLTGLLTGAGGAVDAYGNKLQAEADHLTGLTDAEARKMNAEAGMTNTIGVFMILIGVAVILASVGGILWAYSRLVAAKGPKQPQV